MFNQRQQIFIIVAQLESHNIYSSFKIAHVCALIVMDLPKLQNVPQPCPICCAGQKTIQPPQITDYETENSQDRSAKISYSGVSVV